MNKFKGKLSFCLRANNADVGPPLATRFGNYFINTAKFCKEFNSYTKGLNNYFVVMVYVYVYEQGIYKFYIGHVAVSFLLNMVSFNYEKKEKLSGGFKKVIVKAVYLGDLYKISKYRYGNIEKSSLKTVIGIAKSMNLLIIKNNV